MPILYTVTRVQAAVRGFIWRRRIQKSSDKELAFIGMKPKPRDPKRDARPGEVANLVRRKQIQLEHMRQYDEAIVTLKAKVGCAGGFAHPRRCVKKRGWIICGGQVAPTDGTPILPQSGIGQPTCCMCNASTPSNSQ